MYQPSNTIKSLLLLTKVCRDAQCAKDFKQLMALTGWSQEVLYAVFFSGIFVLLLIIVFTLNKFLKPKYKRRYKKKRFR